jgi:beta-lactam-binding protein with PASTA domain
VRAVALLILIVAIAAGCGGSELKHPTVVPYVVGLSGPNAVQVTRDANLEVDLRERPDEMRFGFVAAQSPREGTKVRRGDTLTIWVSRGPS